MTPPRRCLAHKDGEPPAWWLTENWRAFVRWPTMEVVKLDELILLPHGYNDVEAGLRFPRHQQSRFQPAVNG